MKNLLKVIDAKHNSQCCFLLTKIYKHGIPNVVSPNKAKAHAWIEATVRFAKAECECKGNKDHFGTCMYTYYSNKCRKFGMHND